MDKQPYSQDYFSSPDHCLTFSESFQERLSEDQLARVKKYLNENPLRFTEFKKLISSSLFACNAFIKTPGVLLRLLTEMRLSESLNKSEMIELYGSFPNEKAPEFDTALRSWRSLFILRIMWRDINRLSSMEETTQELSALAEIAIQASISFHSTVLKGRHGTPKNEQGEEQRLFVIGMGKLGAKELNLSSDIDLVFCYSEPGYTDGKKRIENQEFFSFLGKRLIQSLDKITSDGFVFRVDMRLRPYGQSGPLVSHFTALESYYHTQGREWERFAMVKARILDTSDAANDATRNSDKAELENIIRSFVYRKYIDFSMIDALRNLKSLIQQEVRRRKLEEDLKLGSGGIREIEFIAQAFQLIRGGRQPQLQDNRLAVIYPLLAKFKLLPTQSVEALLKAYTFLRNAEHAVQAYNDQQTQALPIAPEPQKAFLEAMDFQCWDDFLATLEQHRSNVRKEFNAVIAPAHHSEGSKQSSDNMLHEFWRLLCHSSEPSKLEFAQDGLALSQATIETLTEFAQSAAVKCLNGQSQARLDQFMPLLLSNLQQAPDTQLLIAQRVLPLVRAIARRSAYLVMLIENNQALEQLVLLTQSSQQIADQLAKHPALLDELLDEGTLYTLPPKSALASDLQQHMLRIDETDLEALMDALRYFKLSHSLRVAACEITNALPLMKVSDYLSFLAEVLIEYCLHIAWNMMTERHGSPEGLAADQMEFLVVGYGKLGGIEMNHGSDLDLVFIHNSAMSGHTDGKKSIDNQTFYLRLGQKLIHLINTQTSTGRLYEVDMRLRPSGNSGLLSTSLNAFQKYQENDAWTWEHQALVRARPVAGSSKLAQAFQSIRQSTLQRARNSITLASDIVEMRGKMRKHLSTSNPDNNVFHLKQDAGGIVDIEFMVQYLVLAWSHEEPTLATYTDNIRILEALAKTNKLSTQEVNQLIKAYKALRVVLHRQTIDQKSNQINGELLREERESVIRIWDKLFNQATQ